MALGAGETGHLADHEEGVYYVQHGATASTARPTLGSAGTAAAVCVWDGSVVPTNAVDGDIWWDTSVPVLKRRTSGTFEQSGAFAAVPLFARKTSDQTVNNSATPVADTALTVSVEANKTYWFDLLLFYESSTSADIRLTFPLPSGATLRWAALPGLSNSTASVNGDMRAQGVTDNGTLGIGGAGVADTAARLSGVLVVGANAGSFTLNWAQLTAEASDTKVKSGSALKLQEVA